MGGYEFKFCSSNLTSLGIKTILDDLVIVYFGWLNIDIEILHFTNCIQFYADGKILKPMGDGRYSMDKGKHLISGGSIDSFAPVYYI